MVFQFRLIPEKPDSENTVLGEAASRNCVRKNDG